MLGLGDTISHVSRDLPIDQSRRDVHCDSNVETNDNKNSHLPRASLATVYSMAEKQAINAAKPSSDLKARP